jgi:hypothetical protein
MLIGVRGFADGFESLEMSHHSRLLTPSAHLSSCRILASRLFRWVSHCFFSVSSTRSCMAESVLATLRRAVDGALSASLSQPT